MSNISGSKIIFIFQAYFIIIIILTTNRHFDHAQKDKIISRHWKWSIIHTSSLCHCSSTYSVSSNVLAWSETQSCNSKLIVRQNLTFQYDFSFPALKLGLKDAICLTDSFVFMPYHCEFQRDETWVNKFQKNRTSHFHSVINRSFTAADELLRICCCVEPSTELAKNSQRVLKY